MPYYPRQYPSTSDALGEMWGALRKVIHAVVLLGIFLMAGWMMISLVVLAWSWKPVAEGALRMDSYSSVILILPGQVGDATWTGWQALALGAVLLAVGAVLEVIRRSGRAPGLSGLGTRFVAALLALSGVAALAWGGYLAATGHLSEGLAVPSILPTPHVLMVLGFSQISYWHSIMMGAIFMSAVVLIAVDGPDYVRKAIRSIRAGELPPIRTDNAWIAVFRMFLAILAFYYIYFIILGHFSVEPEVPEFWKIPLWKQLHAFAEASVWEEILSRVLMLGLPLMLYHLAVGRNVAPGWRYLSGGGFRIDNAAFVLVFIQALVFALAHVAGWDLWKVLPTTISGIAFGYLFLKRGLWASVLLHFTFDYLGMTVDVFKEWGMDIEGSFNVMILFLAAVGVVLLVHYVVIIIKEGPGVLRRAVLGSPTERGDAGGKV